MAASATLLLAGPLLGLYAKREAAERQPQPRRAAPRPEAGPEAGIPPAHAHGTPPLESERVRIS